MEKLPIITCMAALSFAQPAHAGNLRIASVSSPIISACGIYNDTRVSSISMNSAFSLSGVADTGLLRSTYTSGTNVLYTYSVDMSGTLFTRITVSNCWYILATPTPVTTTRMAWSIRSFSCPERPQTRRWDQPT